MLSEWGIVNMAKKFTQPDWAQDKGRGSIFLDPFPRRQLHEQKY
jgi:hypothetical protein